MYIYRRLLPEVVTHLKRKTGVAIIGPRRVGKTFLLEQLKKEIERKDKNVLFFNFDDLELRTKIANQPNFFIDEVKMNKSDYLFIDEAQKLPQIFEQVKMLLDQNIAKVLLSGSSSLEIRQRAAETFGGRVRALRMFPLGLAEIYKTESLIKKLLFKKKLSMRFLLSEQKRLWQVKKTWEDNWQTYFITGFLPEVFLEKRPNEKFFLLKDFVQNYLEKDILLLSRVLQIEDFRKALTQFAFQNGQILNTVHLSNESGLSRKTIQSYLSLLKNTFIIYQIAAFASRKRSSIFKSPKVYFFDTGVANYLLGLSSFEEIKVAQREGALAETFVLSQLLPSIENLAPSLKLTYWQSYQGHEVDFIVQAGLMKIPIEVTLASDVKKEKIKNFARFFQVSGANFGILLYLGSLREIKIVDGKIFAIPLWMWI